MIIINISFISNRQNIIFIIYYHGLDTYHTCLVSNRTKYFLSHKFNYAVFCAKQKQIKKGVSKKTVGFIFTMYFVCCKNIHFLIMPAMFSVFSHQSSVKKSPVVCCEQWSYQDIRLVTHRVVQNFHHLTLLVLLVSCSSIFHHWALVLHYGDSADLNFAILSMIIASDTPWPVTRGQWKLFNKEPSTIWTASDSSGRTTKI